MVSILSRSIWFAAVAGALFTVEALAQVQVPALDPEIPESDMAAAVARIDDVAVQLRAQVAREQVMLPPGVRDGLAVWERLSVAQRRDLLSGGVGSPVAIPTWAVAAVGAAHLAYDMWKNRVKQTGVTLRAVLPEELDYLGRHPELEHQLNQWRRMADVTELLGSRSLRQVGCCTLEPGLALEEKREALTKVSAALTAVADLAEAPLSEVPVGVRDGLRFWEQLSPAERASLLSGGVASENAAIPTWAVAAVGAAHLAYDMYKNRVKVAGFVERPFRPDELDYLEKSPLLAQRLVELDQYRRWEKVRERFESPRLPERLVVDPRLTDPPKPDLGDVEVPMFKLNLDAGRRARAFSRIEAAVQGIVREVPVTEIPPGVRNGLDYWERLTARERLSLLSGANGGSVAVPTWAVAAVTAAQLAYDMYKNRVIRSDVVMRQVSPLELDYLRRDADLERGLVELQKLGVIR